jgi:ribosomal protein S18 acetylase RimI-like enzyme
MTEGYRLASMSDLPGIVRIHQASFPNFFMTELGPRFLKIYYQKVLLYSEHVFWVKQGDDELEGFVCGFIHPYEFYRKIEGQRFRIALAIAFRLVWHPSRFPRLFNAYSEVRRSTQKHEPGVCELSSIAVSPRFSGKGIGHELVKQFIQSVIGKANAIQLTTDALENDDINHFYRNLGFTKVGSYERSKGRLMNKYQLLLESPKQLN